MYKIWLPKAIYLGIPEEKFWHMNPRKMKPYETAHDWKSKYDDFLAWNIGRYIQFAIGSAFSQNNKYPSQAFSFMETQKEQEHDYSLDAIRFEQWAEVANAAFEERPK